MKKLINQLLRFGLVGGLAFLLDYSILYICTEFVGIHYLISAFISYSLSTVFNYIASVYWVFDTNKTKSKGQTFFIFITFSLIGLGLNEILMWLGVDCLHIHYMFVKIGATAIVMVFNFITRKIFLE